MDETFQNLVGLLIFNKKIYIYIVADFISEVRIEKNIFFKCQISNSLNSSHCHGNMERSILKFDGANCDLLINEKVTEFEEKIFSRF